MMSDVVGFHLLAEDTRNGTTPLKSNEQLLQGLDQQTLSLSQRETVRYLDSIARSERLVAIAMGALFSMID